VFAPGYPRQSSDGRTYQAERYSRAELCEALEDARENEMPGYYSVYSFPRGHSQDGNIPKVDCIFIDLDVSDEYDPKNDKTDFDAWRRDMSALLARARMIANAIIEADQQDHFRVTLSGHKGLHLYLDFPTVSPENGTFQQFKAGLKAYGESVMEWLDETVGGVEIDNWVDVDASDLGRLARHPNTIHHGTEYDDETRWCVPITVEELADLRVDDYLELTQNPRWPDDYRREPSQSAGKKVVQAIRSASGSWESATATAGSSYNSSAISDYEERSNDDIELDDVIFLTSNKPCIEAFRSRDDAFNHGNASHLMEMSILSRFVEMGVPRDVMHDFLEPIPGYDEQYTDNQIDQIIAREYGEFNCNKIADRAPTFCLGESCGVYQRNDDIQR
jgi:hypothetical protein